MASLQPFTDPGARYCRDCGGPLTVIIDNLRVCQNTTTQGEQQESKDTCRGLGRLRRNFCEFDGQRVAEGQTVCPTCKRIATVP